MGRETKRYEVALVFFFLVFLFSLPVALSPPASAQDEGLIWINKSANQTAYALGEDILYTIDYGNSDPKNPAYNVIVVDIFPDAEILEVTPPASSVDGNNLTWEIGTLAPEANGSIYILAKHPDISSQEFKETSLVSGYGYVNARKRISTSKRNNTLINMATISATYGGVTKIYSSSVSVDISTVPDAVVKSHEHGSGRYKEALESGLNNSKTNIKLKKDLTARHGSVELSLPGQRAIQLSSLWSDRTEAVTDDGTTVNSVSDEYSYMKSITKETSYSTSGAAISYSAGGNFSGGIARISYDRLKSGGKVPGRKSDVAYSVETYHGDFQMKQSLDAYGESPTYLKESSGTGFVSSQKVVSPRLRSGEQGSGSYQSAESIQGDTVLKNVSLAHEPSEQMAGYTRISYASKWGETMYAHNAEKGTEIINRFSSLDRLQKDAIMSPSFISLTGVFIGTNYLRAKVADAENPGEEALRLERLLTGGFALDTTIALGGTSRYAYPHINLTKRVLERSDYTVTYRIWVNNDGNITLSPVAVVDLLPPGTIFVSSTLKPAVKGRIVTWTLQTLPLGETTVIDLKVILADVSPSAINRVQAAARFLDRTIISAASSSPYDTIESQVEEETSDAELKLWEETTYGLWAPPACYNLNSSVSCTCERDIDNYYDNLTENCAEIP
jgi:uncharacterized repeat protein (TIGR01451 family)